jgi:hypothetical protein
LLKFFRKYNKIILVVGVVVLMASFGIGPAIQNLAPTGGNRSLGTLADGSELTVADQQRAAVELEILGRHIAGGLGLPPRMNPVLQMMGRVGLNPETGNQEEQALAWLLLLRDADRLGLSASASEVEQALQLLGIGQRQMSQIMDTYTVQRDFVRRVVANWLIAEQYEALITGEAHHMMNLEVGSVNSASPGIRRLQLIGSIGEAEGFQQQMQQMQQIQGYLAGGPRISDVIVRHYLQSQQARVGGRLVKVDAASLREQVDEPTDARLQELFDKHRDDLPGEGEPYGLGYRYPDRVKLQYLHIPLEAVRDSIPVTAEGERDSGSYAIESADAYQYYKNNQDEFTVEEADTSSDDQAADGADEEQASDEPTVQDYAEVHDQIIEQLKDQRARQKAAEMAQVAASLLEAPLRSLPDGQLGYKDIPADFEPPSLEDVASQLEERFNLRPSVERIDQWTPTEALSELPQIGGASVMDQQGQFTQYVESARELIDPPSDNPLAPLRLQVGAPSEPLETETARFVFRLTAAEPSHRPESLDAVRDQVAADARAIAAYQQLQSQKDQLLQQAGEEGLDAVASARNASVESFDPTTRRARVGRQQQDQVPALPAVGRSEAFIDAIFDLGRDLQQREADFDELSPAERTGAVELPRQWSVTLVEVTDYQPPNRQAFENMLSSPMLKPQLGMWLQQQVEASSPNPLSFSALADRLGFQRDGSGGGNDEQGDEPSEAS